MALLENKVALITGAARGIGQAIAERFASEGARMILGDVRDELCQRVAASINANIGSDIARAMHLDVSRATDWEAAVRACESAFGGLDVLVNNAGVIGSMTGVEDTSEEEWDFVMEVNLKGPWLGMKFALPAMRRRGCGSIVNVSSTAALVGSTTVPAYHASKAGLAILTKCAGVSYAGERIRVNSIHPGTVTTPMVEAAPKELRELLSMTLNPSKREALPMEIANVAVFLASDQSSYVTGSAVVVDGGFTAM